MTLKKPVLFTNVVLVFAMSFSHQAFASPNIGMQGYLQATTSEMLPAGI